MPNAFQMLIIYNPPDGFEWPERYAFRPARGDVLEVFEVSRAPEHGTLEPVPFYRIEYDNAGCMCIAGVYARSAVIVDDRTATEPALEIMRARMQAWLSERDAFRRSHGLAHSEYSRTSMASCVAGWLDLDKAMRLCERAGWPGSVVV